VRGQPSKNVEGRTVFERDHGDLSHKQKADIAASFQRAAVRAILIKLERALDVQPPSPGRSREVAATLSHGERVRSAFRSIVVGGGVSANSRLRADIFALGTKRTLPVHLPAMEFCVDNAAMIAGLGNHRLREGLIDDLSLAAIPTTAC
jgi:N6-L-threonylcarbamoyladenine synthase